MSIIENREQWLAEFRAGWLAHFQKTGELDWKLYPRIRNSEIDKRPGLELSRCRLGLISTAGGYLRAHHSPFDAANPLGDYSIRTFPIGTRFSELAYAHDHYDHAAVDSDPQVLLPLVHLKDIEREGSIGAVAPDVISFMGYQPDVARVVDEMIPAILEHVEQQGWDAALLVPS
jgi:D-proline reductase (dithiol) PrdB